METFWSGQGRGTTSALTAAMRYRIIEATNEFGYSTSACGPTENAGAATVRSAKAMTPPPWLQNTCSTSDTRTVARMLPAALRNRTRYRYPADGLSSIVQKFVRPVTSAVGMP